MKEPEHVRLTTNEHGQQVIQVHIPPKQWHIAEWKRCQGVMLNLLSKGPLPAKQVAEALQLAGFSPSNIRRTKERTGIISQYRGTVETSGDWWWHCPT